MNKRLLAHMIFGFGYSTAFWQYLEFCWQLYRADLINSVLYSGTIGFPMFHHGYWGFVGVMIGYFYITQDDYRKVPAWVSMKVKNIALRLESVKKNVRLSKE